MYNKRMAQQETIKKTRNEHSVTSRDILGYVNKHRNKLNKETNIFKATHRRTTEKDRESDAIRGATTQRKK